MKASQFYINTLKEAPAEADVVSQKLMIRAGMIKRINAGIYTYMPMGLRVIRKVEAIIREEMNRAGALEITMPMVQPADLWRETGRFEGMGEELLRLKDRHGREFVLQPTSEEVVTDIARNDLKSYKQLPKNFYQIQTKFRDERRPRFGLMRGREFTMKDAYSFDRDESSAHQSYDVMAQTYRRIFDRFGLNYRAVVADSGAIGGDKSEEFQVIATTGEDAIVYCPNSDYAANLEKAEALAPSLTTLNNELFEQLNTVLTLNLTACEAVANYLNVSLKTLVKTMVLSTETTLETGKIHTQLWVLLLRGDHTLNETKIKKIKGLDTFKFASEEQIKEAFGCESGYLGVVNLNKTHSINIIADREVMQLHNWVCGANKKDYHFTGVNWGRDVAYPDLIADIRNVVAGDLSPDGKGELAIERGIEVGHVFYLGTKYSQAMNATFLDIDGRPKPFEMGCYGIGVTRLPAAAIEQNHDDKGMIWPDSIAPFTLVICAVGYERSESVKAIADALYQLCLNHKVDVILDDRGERPGIMFADWELIGVPHRITIGDRGLKEGSIEYQHRRNPLAHILTLDNTALNESSLQTVLTHLLTCITQ